jgi:hypothetical protein
VAKGAAIKVTIEPLIDRAPIVQARTRPLHPERRLPREAPFDISAHDRGGFV